MHQTIVIEKADVNSKVYIKLVDIKGRTIDNVTITPEGNQLGLY